MKLSRVDLGPLVAIVVGGMLGVGASSAFLIGMSSSPAPAPVPSPAPAPAPVVEGAPAPLVFIDGVRMSDEIGRPLLDVLSPTGRVGSLGAVRSALTEWLVLTGTSPRGVDGIESIEVIKGAAAMDRYGPEAIAGVILITLKRALEPAELIEAGRVEEAVELLADASADQAREAAELIFEKAYTDGYQQGDYAFAIRGMSAAKQLPHLREAMHHQLNFWHGFSVYRQAVALQEAQTVESASAALPSFQRAAELMQDTGDYPASVNVNLEQLLRNLGTYVEIQEAIIARAR